MVKLTDWIFFELLLLMNRKKNCLRYCQNGRFEMLSLNILSFSQKKKFIHFGRKRPFKCLRWCYCHFDVDKFYIYLKCNCGQSVKNACLWHKILINKMPLISIQYQARTELNIFIAICIQTMMYYANLVHVHSARGADARWRQTTVTFSYITYFLFFFCWALDILDDWLEENFHWLKSDYWILLKWVHHFSQLLHLKSIQL